MADLVFDAGREFSEGAVVLADQKIGIVSKPVFTPWFRQHQSPAAAFGSQTNGAGWIGQCDRADICRRAQFGRYADKLFHQLAVIRFVGGAWTAEAGRVDAGPAGEGIDHQAAVFANDPAADLCGRLRSFLGGILGKRRAILDHFGNERKVRNADQFDTVRSENLGDFAALLAIAAGENERSNWRQPGSRNTR